MADPIGVHLVRSDERVGEVDALAHRLGGRVGLDGVLDDLNRSATAAAVPGRAAAWGFRWDRSDDSSRRWYPQGITCSADQGEVEDVDGRLVLCTSWYSKDVDGVHKGARISFVDITDPARIRYRHVLLVEPFTDRDTGRFGVRPVKLHAGGIVWHGPYLHVAGTARGISTFRLDDLLRVPTGGTRSELRLHDDGRLDAFGYRYVLPLRFRYDAVAEDGFEKLRYSFLSLDQSTSPHHLVAGEYGRRSMTTRLVRYELDPDTSLLRPHEEAVSRPLGLHDEGVEGMQGAVVVDGTYYVTASAGQFRRGSMYVGRPGAFRRHAGVLPVGPEDLAYWPSTGRLWSLTEYPPRRYVFAMDRSTFDR